MTYEYEDPYRYTLSREIPALGNEGTVLFVMLNPSTADERQDDPTIRRCIDFAARWGFARLEVVNLYALRSTDPRGLFAVDDPVGPNNDSQIERAVRNSPEVIVAWGANPHPGGAERVRTVLDLIDHYAGGARCLGQTARLHPRHPLCVKRDSPRPYFKQEARVYV